MLSLERYQPIFEEQEVGQRSPRAVSHGVYVWIGSKLYCNMFSGFVYFHVAGRCLSDQLTHGPVST